MMFRDMMRNVCGACCAAVVMCASGVWGMEVENKILRREREVSQVVCRADEVSLYPIIDFSCFTCSEHSRVPDRWPSALANISENVKYLLLSTDPSVLLPTYGVLWGLTSHAFQNFARFCASNCCNTGSKEVTINLLKLVAKVLGTFSPDGTVEHVSVEFTRLVDILSKSSVFSILEQEPLFRNVSKIIENHIEPES